MFTHCREADVDWITYRRGGLAATTAALRRYWRIDTGGRGEAVTLADEMVTINDYGSALGVGDPACDRIAQRAAVPDGTSKSTGAVKLFGVERG